MTKSSDQAGRSELSVANKRRRDGEKQGLIDQKHANRQERHHEQKRNKSAKKIASRAKHRLWSIYRDAQTIHNLQLSYKSPFNDGNNSKTTNALVGYALQNWKVIANERCGSWYIPRLNDRRNKETETKDTTCCNTKNIDWNMDINLTSCYFKSTDGHVNTWEFSLKRLNLALIENVLSVDGGCLVVDSSVRKALPDSFSRTIPIWATVLNRTILHYSGLASETVCANAEGNNNRMDRDKKESPPWDARLHTPRGVVSIEEHNKIESLIDSRVQTLIRSGAIVNPTKLTNVLRKPLRVVWMDHCGNLFISNASSMNTDIVDCDWSSLVEKYFIILCWNPSRYELVDPGNCVSSAQEALLKVKKSHQEWVGFHGDIDPREYDRLDSKRRNATVSASNGYLYTPGAADDHESWAQHLTPDIFWKHHKKFLSPTLSEDSVDELIHSLVQEHHDHENRLLQDQGTDNDASARKTQPSVYSYSNQIGDTNLWIGSRRAGRPPDCWGGFQAVLNVTNQEYERINDINPGLGFYYLQLPVEEGKRDRTQLERWMPVGLVFLIHHIQHGRHVLVHCAQGKDRSVAVALIFVILSCSLQFPLRLRPQFCFNPWDLSVMDDNVSKPKEKSCTSTTSYLMSGLPNELVSRLLKDGGREVFLLWVHAQLDENGMANDGADALKNRKLNRLADKESVRIALHLLRQDRDVAEPTRSTMQKVNRFLMSSTIYR